MKIAVTGGSGFIGNHLVKKLVSEGHEIKVLVRKTSNTRLLGKLGVTLTIGDVMDKESVESLVNNAEMVYHLAAQVYTGSRDEFWNVNLQGTENMLEACLNGGIGKFVHVSTIKVMGSIKNPPGDECHLYNPTSPYDRSKCEAEKMALRYHREHGLPVTIVRPTVVYGPGNMYLLRLYQWLQRGGCFIGSMNNLMHPCYIENFLQGITLASERSKSDGKIYIIGDEKPVTWVEYIKTVAEMMGVAAPKIHIPISLMKGIGYLSEFKSCMVGGEPFFDRSWLDEITNDLAYDITKAKQDLGYNPQISLKEGISRTIKWYRQNGFLR